MSKISQQFAAWETSGANAETAATQDELDQEMEEYRKAWDAILPMSARTPEELAAKIVMAMDNLSDEELAPGSMEGSLLKDALAVLGREAA